MTIKITPSTVLEKSILAIIITAIILGGVWFVGNKIINAQLAALKAELGQVKSEFKQQTGEIDTKVTVLMGQVSIKDKQIADLTAENLDLKKKEAKDAADLIAAINKLKDAPPETLVSEGRRILQTKEINYIKLTNTVEFSLANYRTNVIRLTEWEAFSLKIIPDKNNQIANLTKSNEILASENKDLKDVHALDTQWKVIANNTMDHYYQISMKAIAPSFWKQMFGDAKVSTFWGGLGFVLGTVLHK